MQKEEKGGKKETLINAHIQNNLQKKKERKRKGYLETMPVDFVSKSITRQAV